MKSSRSSVAMWQQWRSAAVLACLAMAGSALVVADAEPLTTLVMVDDASLATLGKFPLSRSVYARAIEKARQAGAKGVALKFFIGSPGNASDDSRLAEAGKTLPLLLEVFPGETRSGLPRSLLRDDWSFAGTPGPLRLAGVALPLPALVENAHRLGTVEARKDGIGSRVEVGGLVDGSNVESMQLEIVELATGLQAVVKENRLRFGHASLPLDPEGRVACDVLGGKPPRQHGIDELLDGRIPPEEMAGKVVVLGYGRSDSPTVSVGGSMLPVHYVFYRQVVCLASLLARGAR